MKKLNRKGFTLIELLAIIVILAIIMVVTIPTVLSSMGNAQQNTFNTSANTVADWFEKQYTAAQLGQADSTFTDKCGNNGSDCTTITDITELLDEAGVAPANYKTAKVQIKTSGRACVELTADDSGEFKNVTDKKALSVGCGGSELTTETETQ